MAKDKKAVKTAEKVGGVTEQPQTPLKEGEAEIELLMDHGNCKKGASRIVSTNQADVFVNNKIAKIIRE